MAVTIKFDSANRPENPTLILEKANQEAICVLNTATNIRFKDNLNSYAEISFKIHKSFNGKTFHFWDNLKDFKTVYAPEWRKRFQIRVDVNQSTDILKSITGVSLYENDLSQKNLYEVEINTESDIKRDDYVPTIFYDDKNTKASLLHRVLRDKAFYFKIVHVDESLKKIQRTFSFNGISIYDALQEIAEEIHCLFVFGEPDDTGNYWTISAYDLESYCNDCGYRGEFDSECPKCKSTRIDKGYGEDTTIFISDENLANEITYTTDVDSVKNCFRLEAGDDIMTAAVINSNPSGSQYLWLIPDYMKEDMSDGLVSKIDSYDKDYAYYQNEYMTTLDATLSKKYNDLIEKYKIYNKDLSSIASQIKGYQGIVKAYYDTIDFGGYLKHSLMPSIEMSQTTAQKQAALLTVANLSPVSIENVKYISLVTANSAILNYAKVYIDTAKYQVKVKSSSISGTIWTGVLTVTSWGDEKDTADTVSLRIVFNDNYENFLKQKIDKILAKEEKDDLSIIGLFKKNDADFNAELKKYSLSYLQIFYDSCEACLNILIEQGVADKNKWNSSSDPEGDLYTKMYLPYRNKSSYISQEIQLRENEINIILGKYDENNKLLNKGMQSILLEKKNYISDKLNFQKYLGEYWAEFSKFRREDTWKNENYISDGLDNTEIFKKAKEFLEAAKKDLYKSVTLQHSISTDLKNLLIFPGFEPLKENFALGNWLRIMIDNKVYKLRLISYEIDYDEIGKIDVEFSDVTHILGVISDIQSILKQSKSMSTSYHSVKHQAELGEQSNETVKDWVEKGLDATVTKIVNSADNQDIVYDRHGLLLRKKDDISETYSPEQFKLINSTLAMTNDNWKTCKVGIGKFEYLDPRDNQYKTGYGVIADKLVGNLILSKEIGIYNESGNLTFTTDGLGITNGTNTVTINPNAQNLFVIANKSKNLLYVDNTGNLNIEGKLTASSGSKIGYWYITDNAIYSGNSSFGSANGKYFGTNGLSITDKFKVDANGNIVSSGTLSLGGGKLSYSNGVLSVNGKVAASSGSSFGHWTISDSAIYNGSSTYGASGGKYFGTNGLSISNTFKVDASGNITASGSLNLAGGRISFSNETLNISGKINVDAGSKIGYWRITDDAIYYETPAVGLPGGRYFGSDGLSLSDKFIVDRDGNINAKSGLFGGSLDSVDGTFTNLNAGKSEFHSTWILIDADGQTSVRIGTPDYKDWVDLTLRPLEDNKGNLGTPDYRWSTLYSRVIAQNSVREQKESIQSYNPEQAYDELKNLPLYTYYYKGGSDESKTMALGTMIDYLPSEVMITTPHGNDTYNLGSLCFWSIGVIQILQRKVELLETELERIQYGTHS